MDTKDLDKAVAEIRSMLAEGMRDKYSDEVLKNWLDPQHLGEMERADGYAKLTGACGDMMEFFLRVQNEEILEAKFSTDGCITSIAAGNMGAKLSSGKTIDEALLILPSDILAGLCGLPAEHEHCAQLAADTIQEAIRDYFLSKREPWRKDY
jgi:nitrogen fixation protein NifU and related proteins